MDIKNVERIYALTWLQKGMLRFYLENPEYNFQQYVIQLNGDVSNQLLDASFQALVQTYDVLRCNILYEKIDKPIHVVQKVKNVKVTFFDITVCIDKEVELNKIIQEDKEKKFDLSKDSLLRITLVKLGTDLYKMIFSYHHIVIDGWSLTILISKLFQYYNELRGTNHIELVQVPSFQVYIDNLYQNEDAYFAYWKKYLDGYQTDTVLEDVQSFKKQGKKKIGITFSETDKRKIQKIQSNCDITTNTLLKTIIGIVIQRYINSNDIVFGEVNSGRGWNYEKMENLVGMLINILPSRITTKSTQPFSELVKMIQKQAVECNQNYGLNMIQLQNTLFHGKTLIHFLYNFSNHLKDIIIDDGTNNNSKLGFRIGEVSLENINTSDLCIDVNAFETLTLTLTYSQQKYSDTFANDFLKHIMRVLTQVAENEDILIQDIKLTSDEEDKLILTCFNQEKLAKIHNAYVSDLIEYTAQIYYDKPVLIYENAQMTYGELNSLANGFVTKLLSNGVTNESRVGLFMEKSFDLFITILALIKMHVLYIPIDIEYPESRVEHLIEASKLDYIVVSKNLTCNQLKEKQIMCNYPELTKVEKNEVYPRKNNEICMLFTSGTTGVPNGVILSDENIVNYIFNVQEFMKINSNDVILQQSSVSFDVFIEEVYSSMFVGSTLVIVDKKTLYDNSKMVNTINKHKISVISCSPRYLGVLNHNDIPDVRIFISGGEILLGKYCNNLIKHAKVFNTYGPTETTVCATYHACREGEEENIAIGHPIYNSKVYILDQYKNLQPVNVMGEIYIGGAGVTRPINDEHAKRFIDNPFGEGKLFCSGDIGKWTKDGEILYCNRNDRQIKLRGYRIEQTEIENAILKFPDVEDCYVTVNSKEKSQSQYLIAFIKSDSDIDKVDIMSFLKERIPYYMIPQKYVIRKELNLNLNSKIDEQELMKYVDTGISTNSYSMTTTEIELAKIWAKVLGKDETEINPYDNFFYLGGDSILLIQLYSMVNEKYPGKSVITDSFIFQNLRDYANYIESKSTDQEISTKIVMQEISEKYMSSQKSYTNDNLYRVKLDSDLINSILKQKRYQEITHEKMYKVLLVLAIYSLTRKTDIHLNQISEDINEFATYSFDLTKMHDELDIYNNLSKPEYKTQILDNDLIRINRNISCISILICDQFQQKHMNLTKQFDLCIFFTKEEDQVIMNCKQHSMKLNDTFTQDLFKTYGMIINQLNSESLDEAVERN